MYNYCFKAQFEYNEDLQKVFKYLYDIAIQYDKSFTLTFNPHFHSIMIGTTDFDLYLNMINLELPCGVSDIPPMLGDVKITKRWTFKSEESIK